MTGDTQVFVAPRRAARGGRPTGRAATLRGAEMTWAIAFVIPYAAVFVAFAVYPIGYALWLGGSPSLYAELFDDPRYLRALVNTALYAGVVVNAMMIFAVLLSGFFLRRRWWIKAVLIIFILPWTLPAVPAYMSFHWMLVGREGLVDALLQDWLGITGPIWFNNRWLALACNIVAYVWKWLPLWTLILLAGRMAIPQDLYDAADIDGAGSYRRFRHVTWPLVANLYFVSTLIATIWTLGDFTGVFFVSGGSPAMESDVLATLGLQYALDFANPQLGIAAGLSTLPLLILAVILLVRGLRKTEVQL